MRDAHDALLERLDGIRIAPRRILDLGAGTGVVARRVARRFRDAEVLSVDPVPVLLRRARERAPRWFSRHRHVAGDAERLPLATHCVDLIVSSVAMPWFDPVDDALAECLRTMRPGGLLLLSTLGSGTLKELAAAWSGAGGPPRMHPFADMHVLGDALVHTGFADVVMDVQRIRLKAPGFWSLCRTLSRSGGSGALAARRRGLTAVEILPGGGRRGTTRCGDADGALPVSVEFVFRSCVGARTGSARRIRRASSSGLVRRIEVELVIGEAEIHSESGSSLIARAKEAAVALAALVGERW